MVAIVAGNGLGLSLGSLGGLGSRGSFGDAALGRAGALAYVNASTGNLILQNQDELLAGHGLSASSLRTYNSQGQLNDDNGDNWTLGLYARQIQLSGTVNTAGSTVQRIGRDGAVQVFSFNTGTGTYLSTAGAGAHDVIEYAAGTGELVWTEGSTRLRERYDAQGRLIATNDAAGNSLQYTYGSNGLVSMVSHGNGTQRTYYDYNGTLLTQIRTVGQDGSSETRVRYGYDTSNRLTTVTVDLTPEDGSITDGKVYQTTYTYDGASTRVASVAQSDGTSLGITYKLVGSDYRVETLTDALGAVTRFAYDTANRRTTVTDARLQNTVYTYDAQGQLLQVDAPAVNGTIASTSFQYNGNGDVTRVTDGEGRWVATEYDGWGNATRQTDSAGNVVIRAYSGSQQLIAESIAGDGSTSSASTRFVYAQSNPTQLRFQISPEGRVTEYRYNGFGERNAAIQYAAGAYAVAGLAYDAVPTEATMATWASGRDLTRTQRQDFEYDGLGQLNKSIEYGKVDAQGVGIADDTRSITQYVYDRHGKLLSTINPRNGTTSYTYDGHGRVRTTTDAAQRLTTTIYDDANRKIQVSAFNGLITTSSYDRAGRLVSVLEGSAQTTNLGETTYAYDARNQLLMSKDATGNRHWYVYDAAGRRVGDVDALGTLTEYRFDRNGQVTSTLRYGTLINTAVLLDGSGNPLTVSIDALRPAATAKDQRGWRVYDEVNRLVKEVSALGEVVEYTYDRSSRVVMTRRYATLIDVSTLGDKPAASAIAPSQNAGDGWTRTFYDADGRVAATLDAVGTMVESQYDDAGRLVTTVRRANRVTAANLATGTLAQLRPQAADGDATTRYFYDAQGRLVATLDALNYLTEKVYDANDNVVRELRYSTKSPAATAASSVASLRSGAVLQESSWGYDAVDRVLTQSTDPAGLNLTTRYQYDDANRRLDVTDPAGTVTRTVYDVQGNARSVTVDQGGLGLTTSSTYDAEGRVLTTTDAAGTVTQYGYDALGRKTLQRVDPTGLNVTTIYVYDVQGNLARVIDPNGKQTRYLYDAQGRLRYTLDAEYGLSENVYDGFGRVFETVRYAAKQTGIQTFDVGQGLISNSFAWVNSSAADVRTRYTYDALGRKVVERVDPNGVNSVTVFNYDAQGNLARVIDPNGKTTRYLYDALGRLRYTLDAEYGLKENIYDATGRVSASIQYLARQGGIQTFDVGQGLISNSFVSITTSPTDNVTRYSYDAAGREIYRVDGSGAVTETGYDKAGRVVSQRQYATPIALPAQGSEDGKTVVFKGDYAQLWSPPASIDPAKTYKIRVRLRQLSGKGNIYGGVIPFNAGGAAISSNGAYQYSAVGALLLTPEQGWRTFEATLSGINAPGVYEGGKFFNGTVSASALLIYNYAGNDGSTDLGRLVEVDTLELVDMSTGQVISGGKMENGAANWLLDGSVSGAYAGVATALDATQIRERLRPNANDRTTRHAYDAAGREIYRVDPAGAVTETTYDAAGRVVSQRQYANPIALPAQSSEDGKTVVFKGDYAQLWSQPASIDPGKTYKVRVRLRQLSGQGHIYSGVIPFNAGGAAISSNGAYQYSAVSALLLTPDQGWRTFEATLSGINAPGVFEGGKFFNGTVSASALLIYNYGGNEGVTDLGRLVEVDTLELVDMSTGQVISGGKMENGAAGWSLDRSVSGAYAGVATTLDAAQIRERLRPSATDRTTRYAYDAAGREIYRVDPAGAVTETSYDAAGRVVSQRQYANPIALPAQGSEDGKTLVVKGNEAQIWGPAAPIDPSKTYKVRVRLRQLSGQGYIYSGVIPFNAAGASFSANGAYQYSAVGGLLLTPDQGWRTFEATVKGINAPGVYDGDKFFNGTVSASALLIYNYGGNQGVTDLGRLVEVDSLELIDMSTGQIVSGGKMENGSAGWSMDSAVSGAYAGVATALDASQIRERLRPSAGDRTTRYAYDGAGREIYRVDPAGAVTEMTYDASGRVVSQRQYANPIALPAQGSEDGKTLVVKGDYAQITSSNLAFIDPGKTYKVRVRLRQLSGQGYIYGGVVPFGANGAAIDVRGSYLYSAVSSHLLTPEQGWKTFEGTISGVAAPGVNDPAKFFNGTVSAGAMLIYNYAGGEGSTDLGRLVEVDTIELIDMSTGLVVSGGKMENGAAGWSLDRSVSGAYAGVATTLDAAQIRERLRPSATDRTTRYAYDAAGREIYRVDPAGAVTETSYDAAGRVVSQRQYANPIALPAQGSEDGKTLVVKGNEAQIWGPAAPIDPSKTYKVRVRLRQLSGQGYIYSGVIPFNAAGASFSANGAYQYSAVGGLLLTPDQGWRTFEATVKGINAPGVYDGDKFFNGTVSASALLIYNYGGNQGVTDLGRLVEVDSLELIDMSTGQIVSGGKMENGAAGWSMDGMSGAYAGVVTPLDASQIRERLRPSASDRTTRYAYDAAGREIYRVDPAGAVTETSYDAAGRVVSQRQYANPIALPTQGSEDGKTLVVKGNEAQIWGPATPIDPSKTYKVRVRLRQLSGQGYIYSGVIPFNAAGASFSANGAYQYSAVGGLLLTPDQGWRTFEATVKGINAPGVYDGDKFFNGTAAASALLIYNYGGNQGVTDLGRLVEVDSLELIDMSTGQIVSGGKMENGSAGWSMDSAVSGAYAGVATALDASQIRERLRPSAGDRTTRYAYDAAGRPAYLVDAIGGVTRQRFNSEGELVESIRYGRRYDGTVDVASLDAFYASAANQTSLDRSTRFVLDELGRTRFTVDAQGGVVETIYDGFGKVARTRAYSAVIDPTWIVDSTGLLAIEDLTRADIPNARETVYAYDADGRLRFTAVSQRIESGQKKFSVTERQYDAFDEVVGTTSFDTLLALQAQPKVFSSGDIEALVTRVAAKDRSRQMSYDAAGRLTTSVDGEGYTESYEYDGLGNKTKYTNQAQSIFTYAYDVMGRLTLETSPQVNLGTINSALQFSSNPGQVLTRMSYNAFGQLAARTEAEGRAEQRTTRYEYDALGRQTVVRYEAVGVYDVTQDDSASNGTNGTIARTEAQTGTYSQTVYDVFGQAVINRDVGGAFSYKTYDRVGRLVHEVDGNHAVTTHAYSAIDGESSGFTRLSETADIADSLGLSAAAIDLAVSRIVNLGTPRSSLSFFDRLGRIVVTYDKISRTDYTRAQLGSADLVGAAYSFDLYTISAGRLAGQIDYAYNAFGEVIQRAEVLERLQNRRALTRYVYDQQGQVVREVNAEGYVTQHERNAFGEEVKVTQYARAIDPAGDVNAQPVSSRAVDGGDPAGGYDRVMVTAFDRRGVKASETQQGTQIGVRWSDRSLARQVVDVVTTFTNDALGRQKGSSKVVIGNGAQIGFAETTSTFFDALGRTTGTIDEAGRAVVYDRDAYGNALRITRLGARTTDGNLPGPSSIDQTTLQVYDKLSRLVWTREATGAETFYSRNARGQVVKQWQPFTEWALQDLAPTTWASLTVHRNAVQYFGYDKVGRQTATATLMQRAAGDALTYTKEDVVYNNFGEITARLRDGAVTEQSWYDLGGRMWKVTTKGVTTIYWYDLQGNVSSSFTSDTINASAFAAVTDVPVGMRRATTIYDRLGRAVSQTMSAVTHDEGRAATQLATTQTLDAWGNVLSVTRNGVLRQSYRYDAGNHAIATYVHNVVSVNENGASSSAAILSQAFFDASGRQVGAIDGNGISTSWVFNNAGLLDTVYRADKTMESYWYDGLGRMMNRYDALGRQYTYSYDKADREISRMVFVPGARTYQLAQARYDELGRKISDTSGEETSISGQTTLYWYDGRGNLTMSAKPQGQRTSYAYDAANNKVRETDANGLVATWGYNAANQLTSHIDIGGASYSYGYDLAGALKTQTSTRGQSLSYEYAANGQLRQVTDNYRGSSTRYDYDAEGNRTRETFKENSLVYREVTSTYDAQGRLSTAQDTSGPNSLAYSFTVSYDAVGNRRRVVGSQGYRTFNSDTAAQDTTPRPFDQWFTYDEMNRVVINEGVLTNGVISDVGAKNVFYYDGEGRRRQSLTMTGGPSPGGTRLDYEFDFADRLTKESTRKLTYSGGFYTAGDAVVKHAIEYKKEGTQVDDAWDTLFSGEQFKRTTSTTTFDTNGRAISRKDFVEGIASSQTTYMTPQSWAEQTMSYDAVGNLMRVNATAYAFKGTTGGTTQVRATYKNSVTTTDYSYYLQEGYLERGQSLSGQVWGENSSIPTNMVPSESIQSYDANGNLLQLQRGTSYRWYVTDNGGHIVNSWATTGSTLSGANQDAVMKVWTPINGVWSGAAGALAAMPATPTVSLTKDLYREKQLYLNDRRVGMIQESRRNIAGKGGRDPYRIETSSVDMDVSGLRYDTSLKEGSTITYTVQAGETLQSLALRFYGDDALWYRIAEANTLDDSTIELKPGQSINIPQVTRSLNSSSSGAVYRADTLIGDTSAPVVMPPPPPMKEGCGALGMFLVMIVTVVVAAVTYNYLIAEGVYAALAGAVAGAAGSVAGQAVGMAIGAQDSFSWKQVGMGAIGGAVMAGMGGGPNMSPGDLALRAAAANALTQGIGVVTGLQDSFNWKSVAIAAVAAPIADKIGKSFGEVAKDWQIPDEAMKIGQGLVRGMVSQTVSMAVMGKGKINYAQVIGDAFGNAIGDSIASRSKQGQGPWSSADYRNGSDVESDSSNPASAYGYRNGSDVESDAFRPAMAYGYRNGSDVESDSVTAARETEQWMLASNRTMLNAAERAALPEAYMSIERLSRVTVSGVSQATIENANETQRLRNRAAAGASDRPVWNFRELSMAQTARQRAQAAAELNARIEKGPQVKASVGGMTLSESQERLRLNLGAAIALPVVAAPVVVATGGSTVATLGRIYTTVGPMGAAGLGFLTGGGMDAAGQLWQNGEVRWVQSAFAGGVGALSGPVGATSGLMTNIVIGSAGSILNTSFNNVYYGENSDVLFPAVLGGAFGAAGYYSGSLTTKFVGNFKPEVSYPNLNPRVPLLFQAPTISVIPGVFGTTAGGVTSGVASFVPPPPEQK